MADMEADKTPEILIVGAGPVGLTAAIELKRRGFHPRIISANTGPVHESRALAINNRSLRILAASGASERLMAIGRNIHGMRFSTVDKQLFHVSFGAGSGAFPFVLIVPQSRIETVLVEVLAALGVAVEWNTELIALKDPEAPSVKIFGPGGPRTETTDIVIGADGAHSAVRHQLGLAFPGSAYATSWGLADAEITGALPVDEVSIFDLAPVLYAVIPIDDSVVRLISDQPEVLDHLPAAFQVKNVLWQSTFHISHRQVPTYQVANIFLAGDAAHIHSPFGGRGMNLGIEDAAWLAWLIGAGHTERYTADRRPVGHKVLRLVNSTTRMMASNAMLPKLLRRQLLPPIMRAQFLRSRVIDTMSGADTPFPPWLDDT